MDSLTLTWGVESLKPEPFQIWDLIFVLVSALEYDPQNPPYSLSQGVSSNPAPGIQALPLGPSGFSARE